MAKAGMTKEMRARKRKRFRRKVVGFAVFLLSVIGVAAIIGAVVNIVGVALDDTDEKLEYEKMFSALVSLDLADFTSIEKANPEKLKEAAILTAIAFGGSNAYERDEWGYTSVPTADIDRYSAMLFGPSVKLENATFGREGLISGELDRTGYEYVPEEEKYIAPPTVTAGLYYPKVESITRSGNTKTLLIAYMQDVVSDTGIGRTSGDSGTVVKYREYVLIKSGDAYYLYSIVTPQQANSPAQNAGGV